MDWSGILPVLVGGGISLLTSVVMLGLSIRLERRKTERLNKKEEALNAFLGLNKLMQTLNSIENLGRHIDREFNRSADEASMVEAASILRPIIGAEPVIEDVSAKEMLFLASSDGELPAAISEIQQRARNNRTVVEEYNKLRILHDTFLENHCQAIEDIEGSQMTYTLSGKDAIVASIKIGRMNQLIAALIEAVEEDRTTIQRVTEAYVLKAVEKFGSDFPVKRLEKREGKFIDESLAVGVAD